MIWSKYHNIYTLLMLNDNPARSLLEMKVSLNSGKVSKRMIFIQGHYYLKCLSEPKNCDHKLIEWPLSKSECQLKMSLDNLSSVLGRMNAHEWQRVNGFHMATITDNKTQRHFSTSQKFRFLTPEVIEESQSAWPCRSSLWWSGDRMDDLFAIIQALCDSSITLGAKNRHNICIK